MARIDKLFLAQKNNMHVFNAVLCNSAPLCQKNKAKVEQLPPCY